MDLMNLMDLMDLIFGLGYFLFLLLFMIQPLRPVYLMGMVDIQPLFEGAFNWMFRILVISFFLYLVGSIMRLVSWVRGIL